MREIKETTYKGTRIIIGNEKWAMIHAMRAIALKRLNQIKHKCNKRT